MAKSERNDPSENAGSYSKKDMAKSKFPILQAGIIAGIILVLLLLIPGKLSPAGRGLQGAVEVTDKLRDISPSAEEREISRNLLRLLVVHLENYVLVPENTTDGNTKAFSSLMARLKPKAKSALLDATRKFSAKDERFKKDFFGPFYAPSPEARIKTVPTFLRYFKQKKSLFIRPRLSGLPEHSARAPEGFGQEDGHWFGFASPLAAAPAPPKRKVMLDLKKIRVIQQNDDDTDEDEIYLGVMCFRPGSADQKMWPAPGEYWEIGGGKSKTFDLRLADFSAPQKGLQSFVVIVNVFEYDDGTWGEVWSTLVQLGQFAFEQWLNAEIGSLAAGLVMVFLDDLFSWIADWFQNPDDYIGAIGLEALVASGGKSWQATKIKNISGEDAHYEFTFEWRKGYDFKAPKVAR